MKPVTAIRNVLGDYFDRSGTAVFLTLALVVGVIVGASSALLILAIGWVADGVELLGEALSVDRAIFLLTVPLGFGVAAWLARRFAPEAEGDGVPAAMAALAVRGGRLRLRAWSIKILATAATLGSGGSAGREGPIVQIGATVGSVAGRYGGQGEDRVRSLVAAGAGAAIGASFNAPIAGMLFAMEVILGNFNLRHLNGVVVSSVAAAVTSRLLIGQEQLLQAFSYQLEDPRELILFAGLGVAAAAAAFVLLRLLDITETIVVPGSFLVRSLIFGLAVGALGLLYPEVLGDGQDYIAGLLRPADDAVVWYTLLAIAGVKIVATSITLGARASGGAFMPSLFIGAALGSGIAELLDGVWGVSELEPGAFAVVGMAATFAAVARAPLTSILIVFEITGDYGLVLPLMLAGSLATFLADRLHPESAYTMALVRAGIKLTQRGDVDLLDTVTVGAVMTRKVTSLSPGDSLSTVERVLDEQRHHGLPVVEDGRLAGIITVSDLARAGDGAAAVREAMTPRPVTVTPRMPVSVALERMAALGVGRLPVVSDDDPTRLVGMFRRESAVAAYHEALSASTEHQLKVERLRLRTDPGARFFEFRIPKGSMADERQVKETEWPEGLTLVSVQRGRVVMVPSGGLVIRRGDIVTAFGTEAARRRVIERLNATGLEETAEMPVLQPPEPPD
ncbi:MAG: CBS domain-containing protein [Acidimicrobiia bacterium]|nr:chloride channel protein [Acidimicrobiia bacterium]NNF09141.1 CBS domain-containing protein [Acidimicrobiia bacterium]NNL70488.1 CBS domain-containing protein [Acidimicrobiia bacterium]